MVKKNHTNGERNDEPLTIRVNLLVNGSVYALDPLSKNRVKEHFPEAEGLPKVFLGMTQGPNSSLVMRNYGNWRDVF